jgi:hypothetical protein
VKTIALIAFEFWVGCSRSSRAIIGAFIARYNADWLIECLGHRTPAAAGAAARAA